MAQGYIRQSQAPAPIHAVLNPRSCALSRLVEAILALPDDKIRSCELVRAMTERSIFTFSTGLTFQVWKIGNVEEKFSDPSRQRRLLD